MRIIQSRSALPALALVSVTAVWGSTFFLIKDLVTQMPPLDFLGVRFAIAGALIALVQMQRLKRATRADWVRGATLGGVYSLGQVTQTVGLQYTDASISGFITGMYVVLTPILAALLFRQRVAGKAWGAVVLATVGLGFLSLKGALIPTQASAEVASLGGGLFHGHIPLLGFGETLTLIGAAFYALHIVLLGHWAKRSDPVTLGAIQLVAAGGFLGASALPGGATLPQTPAAWVSLLYMAVVAGIGAIMVQTWAQSKMQATTAAVIMTGEPVFAAAFAIAFGGEVFGARLAVGGTLVLAAMLLVEVWGESDDPTQSGGEQDSNDGGQRVASPNTVVGPNQTVRPHSSPTLGVSETTSG